MYVFACMYPKVNSIFIFPLKGHFLVIYYRCVENNWIYTHIHTKEFIDGCMRNTDVFTCIQHKKEKRGRKLSLWTNESSPFSRLSLTLMGPPMLRCLPRIIKAAQARGWQESLFLFVCVRAFVSWTPPGEAASSGCHSEPFFPFLLPKWVSLRRNALKLLFAHICLDASAFAHDVHRQ